MSFKTFFSPMCETRELHVDPELRTRYYRNKYKDVVEALKEVAIIEKMEVREINDVHKEIYVLGNGYDCIITVTQVTPIEAGVDLKVNYFSAMGFHRPKKKVLKIYEELKKILKFKGLSLHP